MKTLLFIPMYNCEKQIVRVLNQLNDEVCNYIHEVIIVNNRSTDAGEKTAIKYCKLNPTIPVKILRNDENYGSGGSHKIAFNYAIDSGFDYVIVLHGDDQGSIHDILPHLISGEAYKYDSFLGSRFEKQSNLINYSKFRIFGNYVFNLFMTICLSKKITDLGSGLNMYSTKYLSSRFYMQFINNLTFYVYMLIYGVYSQSNFKFFPLSWREDDQVSNAKFFKQSREILSVTFRYLLHKEKAFLDNSCESFNYISQEVYSYDCNERK